MHFSNSTTNGAWFCFWPTITTLVRDVWFYFRWFSTWFTRDGLQNTLGQVMILCVLRHLLHGQPSKEQQIFFISLDTECPCYHWAFNFSNFDLLINSLNFIILHYLWINILKIHQHYSKNLCQTLPQWQLQITSMYFFQTSFF